MIYIYLFAFLALCALGSFAVCVRDARAVVPQYTDWLEVLDSQEWRTEDTLVRYMKKLKQTQARVGMIFLVDIRTLIENGLVETRPVMGGRYPAGGHLAENAYRLTDKRHTGGGDPPKRRPLRDIRLPVLQST